MGRIRKRFWDMSEGVRDQFGGFTTDPQYPWPRRVARWLKAHWLEHWKWWVGITINVVGLAIGFAQYSSC